MDKIKKIEKHIKVFGPHSYQLGSAIFFNIYIYIYIYICIYSWSWRPEHWRRLHRGPGGLSPSWANVFVIWANLDIIWDLP